MNNALPKLIGAAALVAVIGGGVFMMMGHKSEVPVPPPVTQTIVAPPPVVEAKSKYKRDMLDYEEVAAAPVVKTAPVAAAVPPPSGRILLDTTKALNKMKLESPHIKANEKISLYYTCNQKNTSPALSWSDAPSGTKGFVLIMEGPDKGRGNLLQWGVYNIPASETSLPEGLPKSATIDKGAQAQTEIGPIGYSGPCVPKGEVTFTFSVYALDTDLNLQPGATRDELFKAMNGHIIDMGKLPVSHYYRL